jgi:hypothetical protein
MNSRQLEVYNHWNTADTLANTYYSSFRNSRLTVSATNPTALYEQPEDSNL